MYDIHYYNNFIILRHYNYFYFKCNFIILQLNLSLMYIY